MVHLALLGLISLGDLNPIPWLREEHCCTLPPMRMPRPRGTLVKTRAECGRTESNPGQVEPELNPL